MLLVAHARRVLAGLLPQRAASATPSAESQRALAKADAGVHLGDRRLLRRTLFVLGLTILGFFLHGALHYQAGTIAMFGAVLVLLLSRVDLHDVLAEVEWPTIFFFVGLFIVVGGIEEIGLLEQIAQGAVSLTGGDPLVAALVLLWFAGIASAIVDNIPAVATLIPLTFSMSRLLFPELAGLDDAALAAHPDVTPLWWALALGACLGGNGTLVGASANVVAVGIADRRGEHDRLLGLHPDRGAVRVGEPDRRQPLHLAALLRVLADLHPRPVRERWAPGPMKGEPMLRLVTLVTASLLAMELVVWLAVAADARDAGLDAPAATTIAAGIAIAVLYTFGGLVVMARPVVAALLFVLAAVLGFLFGYEDGRRADWPSTGSSRSRWPRRVRSARAGARCPG